MRQRRSFTQFVHEYTDDNGVTRYCVAQWQGDKNEYVVPHDARTRALTGCFASFARTPNGLGGFTDRRKALRRARYLFGQEED